VVCTARPVLGSRLSWDWQHVMIFSRCSDAEPLCQQCTRDTWFQDLELRLSLLPGTLKFPRYSQGSTISTVLKFGSTRYRRIETSETVDCIIARCLESTRTKDSVQQTLGCFLPSIHYASVSPPVSFLLSTIVFIPSRHVFSRI